MSNDGQEASSAGIAELRRAAQRPSNEVWRSKLPRSRGVAAGLAAAQMVAGRGDHAWITGEVGRADHDRSEQAAAGFTNEDEQQQQRRESVRDRRRDRGTGDAEA